uniref:SJCHGC01839 protein n=1 Tax=Schistosoma japonicum TaxID=6182 RepID=Q5DEN9_SCHJA|nr:SJCHGC01839 protein [Schistosoma japonicum]
MRNMHTKFLLVLVNIYKNSAVNWHIEDEEILALHNAYREAVKFGRVRDQPKAISMSKLQWSYQLAKLAENWTIHCIPKTSGLKFRNSSKWTYVGQNVAVVSKIRDAPAVWFNQHRNYNYTKNVCAAQKICADYKQLAYASTTHIGCAYKFCEKLNGTGKILVVCNYGPGGKFINRKPYQIFDYDDFYLY